MKNAGLYETHIYTRNLEASVEFYQNLELELAYLIKERGVAFFWLGDRQQMLGIWEVPKERFRTSHFAFHVTKEELAEVPAFLEKKGIQLTPAFGLDTSEPIVHAWVPAACYYFHDNEGNELEYLAMLNGVGRPELGAIHISKWEEAVAAEAE